MSDEIVAGSSPAPSASSVSSPAPATVAPTGGTPTAPGSVASPQSAGEPPRERWDAILANARQKARSEAEAEWRQRFQPYEEAETDPWSFVSKWLDRAENHSVYGPMVKQRYQSRTQQAQPAQEPSPDVPIMDQNGNITGKTYSAERLKEWQRWNDAASQAKYDARLSPIENHIKQQQQREQRALAEKQVADSTQKTIADLEAQPYFKEHKQAIGKALFEHPEWGTNVHQAYNYVLTTQIIPTLSTAERQDVISTLQQQGAATTVAPSGTATGTPKFRDFGTAARYYKDHPEEAAAMANRR